MPHQRLASSAEGAHCSHGRTSVSYLSHVVFEEGTWEPPACLWDYYVLSWLPHPCHSRHSLDGSHMYYLPGYRTHLSLQLFYEVQHTYCLISGVAGNSGAAAHVLCTVKSKHAHQV